MAGSSVLRLASGSDVFCYLLNGVSPDAFRSEAPDHLGRSGPSHQNQMNFPFEIFRANARVHEWNYPCRETLRIEGAEQIDVSCTLQRPAVTN